MSDRGLWIEIESKKQGKETLAREESTEALEVKGEGCFLRVRTVVPGSYGSNAVGESVTFAKNIRIKQVTDAETDAVSYELVSFDADAFLLSELRADIVNEIREEVLDKLAKDGY